MIKYQDNIINLIDSFTIDTFPRTVLFMGESGSGRHSIINYAASKLGFEITDITDSISLDTVNEIYMTTQLHGYTIDIDSISIKEQNVILKLLEEPPVTSFIFLLSSSMVLSTVLNRCYVIKMNTYSKDELEEFVEDKDNKHLILAVANTPGQVMEFQKENFSEMYLFANKIFKYIKTANVSNILSIPNKMYFTIKEKSEDKFDIILFSKLLLFLSKVVSPNVYVRTDKLLFDMRISNVSKKPLFENYLLDIKYLMP